MHAEVLGLGLAGRGCGHPRTRFSFANVGERSPRVGEAERINRKRKEQYLEKIVRGIAAEPSRTHHGFTMVYPLEEGPLMTVPGGFSAGTFLSVRVTEVLSSGLVAGEVVDPSRVGS